MLVWNYSISESAHGTKYSTIKISVEKTHKQYKVSLSTSLMTTVKLILLMWAWYSQVPYNDVSAKNGVHIWWWSCKTIMELKSSCCTKSHSHCNFLVQQQGGVTKLTALPVIGKSSPYNYVTYIILGNDNKVHSMMLAQWWSHFSQSVLAVVIHDCPC